MSDAILEVQNLRKNFAALAAVDQVTLEVRKAELHAVIGPNGAGKTTLINLLSGDLFADSGVILFRGADISRLAPDRRSFLGIGRSYQKTNVFPAFSAFENCRLAAQSRAPRALRWMRAAESYTDTAARARHALDAVGLGQRAQELALALSHGEQRQLEIAMSIATAPQLLLLDEPLAGMGLEEADRMIDLIANLAESHAVLLVEHDMDAVFRLAKVLTVMANGKVLASGTPEEIRADRAVQNVYLGLEALAQ